ncbi:hypothetical protein GQ54DRAFT_308585 [Martensiomyces pterosporus]|nr:hypothetical protein GQ54DRAFT_308585 [Martensiomyces pterosporus]
MTMVTLCNLSLTPTTAYNCFCLLTRRTTIVSARPISRVLSIFRPSSSSRSSSAAGAPPLPKRSATDRRQGGSASRDKDRDREFEAKWAKGDWPEWVKKGEYLYERRTLVEMGYSKDRVVEALEVNDFNLMQATEYLLSS